MKNFLKKLITLFCCYSLIFVSLYEVSASTSTTASPVIDATQGEYSNRCNVDDEVEKDYCMEEQCGKLTTESAKDICNTERCNMRPAGEEQKTCRLNYSMSKADAYPAGNSTLNKVMIGLAITLIVLSILNFILSFTVAGAQDCPAISAIILASAAGVMAIGEIVSFIYTLFATKKVVDDYKYGRSLWGISNGKEKELNATSINDRDKQLSSFEYLIKEQNVQIMIINIKLTAMLLYLSLTWIGTITTLIEMHKAFFSIGMSDAVVMCPHSGDKSATLIAMGAAKGSADVSTAIRQLKGADAGQQKMPTTNNPVVSIRNNTTGEVKIIETKRYEDLSFGRFVTGGAKDLAKSPGTSTPSTPPKTAPVLHPVADLRAPPRPIGTTLVADPNSAPQVNNQPDTNTINGVAPDMNVRSIDANTIPNTDPDTGGTGSGTDINGNINKSKFLEAFLDILVPRVEAVPVVAFGAVLLAVSIGLTTFGLLSPKGIIADFLKTAAAGLAIIVIIVVIFTIYSTAIKIQYSGGPALVGKNLLATSWLRYGLSLLMAAVATGLFLVLLKVRMNLDRRRGELTQLYQQLKNNLKVSNKISDVISNFNQNKNRIDDDGDYLGSSFFESLFINRCFADDKAINNQLGRGVGSNFGPMIYSVDEAYICLNAERDFDISCTCKKTNSCFSIDVTKLPAPLNKMSNATIAIGHFNDISTGKKLITDLDPYELRQLANSLEKNAENMALTFNKNVAKKGVKAVPSIEPFLKEQFKILIPKVTTAKNVELYQNYESAFSAAGVIKLAKTLEKDFALPPASGKEEQFLQMKKEVKDHPSLIPSEISGEVDNQTSEIVSEVHPVYKYEGADIHSNTIENLWTIISRKYFEHHQSLQAY